MSIRARVENLLGQPVHGDYTDHSVKHSDRIVEKLDGLTKALMESSAPLSPLEVYILLAASYLHDLGMQDERYSTDAEWIREHHHELTRNIILQSLEQCKEEAISLDMVPIPGIANVVARVAEAHRKVDLFQDRFDPFWHGGESVRPRLLAALLRIGDELDIDYRRAPMERLKLKRIHPQSLFHWFKCYYVSGVQIVNEYVTVWYQFPEGCKDYERLIIPLVDGKIKAAFAELEGILRQYGVRVAVGRSRVRYDPTLKPMPPEVEAFAREQSVGLHMERIRREMEEVAFIKSSPVEKVMLEIVDA